MKHDTVPFYSTLTLEEIKQIHRKSETVTHNNNEKTNTKDT